MQEDLINKVKNSYKKIIVKEQSEELEKNIELMILLII